MNWLAIIRVAIRALNRNKLRTALTMLGIIIGVGAVIALVSIGQGAQAMIQDQINGMGTNMMIIVPGNVFFGGASLGAGAASTLTEEDVQAMVREIPTIAAASPVVRASGQMVFGNQNWFSQIQGSNEKFPQIRNWQVERGAFFTDLSVRSADRVIVLGKTVADKLFPGMDPVGQMMRVRNLPFRVIGILAAKGQSMVGQDQDDVAIVPYTTAQRKLLGQQIPSINQAMISAISPEASSITEKQVAELLRQRHKIPPGQTDDFTVRNMTDVAQTSAQVTTLLTVLLGSIAAISLIVGGIGIMNIMLVSVTERTREVGIRKAMGARRRDVLLQFLIESATMALVGGFIGVALGATVAKVVTLLVGMPSVIKLWAVAAGLLVAASVGIFFGVYPARRAARLDPIAALRFEL
jgi:putative ABC transport system permease protein